MTPLLAGQTAIVTGAGRGLGRSIAETLAALGASVVVASRNAPELDEVANGIKARGGRALAQTADVADERQVQELVVAAERWVGPPAILVNNAGVLDPIGPLAETSGVSWLRNIAVNVGGTYLVTRAVLPGMLDRDYGRVVNISSGGADRANAGWSAYSTAKAAVDQLTRVLAIEMEATGVTVCAFHPGYMDAESPARAGLASREARVIAYLCTPAAKRNGAVLERDDPALERAAVELLG